MSTIKHAQLSQIAQWKKIVLMCIWITICISQFVFIRYLITRPIVMMEVHKSVRICSSNFTNDIELIETRFLIEIFKYRVYDDHPYMTDDTSTAILYKARTYQCKLVNNPSFIELQRWSIDIYGVKIIQNNDTIYYSISTFGIILIMIFMILIIPTISVLFVTVLRRYFGEKINL
jgi:hypothetical protein